ncbi:IS110 family transposase [Devosia sp. D6-9]|nr:IS110 family transposase [Devosia sp. D6-9]
MCCVILGTGGRPLGPRFKDREPARVPARFDKHLNNCTRPLETDLGSQGQAHDPITDLDWNRRFESLAGYRLFRRGGRAADCQHDGRHRRIRRHAGAGGHSRGAGGERGLRQELARRTGAGRDRSWVNPQRARDFARASGQLAKTDALDATMLAEMGRALRLVADPLPEAGRERLGLLSRRRDQLVAMRTQEKQRRIEITDPFIGADLDRHLAGLNQAIAAIEVEIQNQIGSDAALAQDQALIRSVPGIGPVTASVLAALMPELGRRSGKQIATLAGLAPLNNDSGRRRGQRSIRGGRRRVRQALYMAAVASLRTQSPLNAFYHRLRQAGKPPKPAPVALARKLLVTINAIMKTRTGFAT